jgi:hypothetical protein
VTYKIKRSFRADDKQARVIKRGLTLEEAKKHCQDPKTRKEGEWFDYYLPEE